jgi:predicted amidophosphoribosyltransferase
MPTNPSRAAGLLDLLAPPRCLCCRAALTAAGTLCQRCDGEIALAAPIRLRADALDGGFAALPYRGAGRRLVAALKFGRLRPAAGLGARLIAGRAPPGLLAGALVPVPAAPLRNASRGIDPPAELACALADLCGLPVLGALRRRDLGHQRGRSRRRRIASPPAIAAAGPVPDEVVIVDDVVTTGATLDACAAALRRAGARRVAAVALAAAMRQRRVAVGRGAPIA